MASKLALFTLLAVAALLFTSAFASEPAQTVEEEAAAVAAAVEKEETTPESSIEHVLTLDSTNFSDTIAQNSFVVVEFYAPWCGHCKRLAPEYEKAAEALKAYEKPIVLAKVNADEENNKPLAQEYGVQGYPTLKVIRNNGASVSDYKGPREADGIISYLKKLSGPPSVEITSAEKAVEAIENNTILIVGVFSSLTSEEFENFTAVADTLRSEYDFAHTLDASYLPAKETALTTPGIRLFKKFDEGFSDLKEFSVETVTNFVEEESLPSVVVMNKDPVNTPFLIKIFSADDAKVLLFINVTSLSSEELKSAYADLAKAHKGKNMRFVLVDAEESQNALQYFSLSVENLPIVLLQDKKGEKYTEEKVESSRLSSWLQDYFNGALKKFIKSQPIPEKNDEPVKVVVADTLDELVINSGKNVLLEFYAPWCGHCKKLVPILDEVAKSFQSDPTVVIAKIDATANDITSELFDVKGYPTLYFHTASGKLVSYNGNRSQEDLIDFINQNKDSVTQTEVQESGSHDEL